MVRTCGVFNVFGLEICFAPQRNALFRHLNFQKWSENEVFCRYDTVLTSKSVSSHNRVHYFDISTSRSGPDLVCFKHVYLELCFEPKRRAVFHLQSGHMAPHPPLYAALASRLFDPPEPQIIENYNVLRLFYLFAHPHLLSSDSFSSLMFSPLLFSSLTLPISAFHLSILSDV